MALRSLPLALSLVVLTLDLGGLGSSVLVDESESILILTLNELILLPGNSVLVGLQVNIRGSLGSSSSIKISGLSSMDEGLGNFIISGLKGSIEGGLLGFDGSGIGGLSSGESSSILVISTGESGSSIGLGFTSSGISSSGS